MKLKSVFSILIYFLLQSYQETQLKGKESNQGMMLTLQHQLKKKYIQWRGLQSQTIAKITYKIHHYNQHLCS